MGLSSCALRVFVRKTFLYWIIKSKPFRNPFRRLESVLTRSLVMALAYISKVVQHLANIALNMPHYGFWRIRLSVVSMLWVTIKRKLLQVHGISVFLLIALVISVNPNFMVSRYSWTVLLDKRTTFNSDTNLLKQCDSNEITVPFGVSFDCISDCLLKNATSKVSLSIAVAVEKGWINHDATL